MFAYEIQARIKAGLTLTGYEDGKYEWVGTDDKWLMVDRYEINSLNV